MSSHIYFIVSVVCVLLAPDSPTVSASFFCQDGWILNNTKCYYFSTDIVTWDEADGACQAKNAKLAEIYDETTDDLLTENNSSFWIGLTDRDDEGVFTWNSVNALNYTNWMTINPDNFNNADCVVIYQSAFVSGWNDVQCDSENAYICERNVQDACFWIGLTNISESNRSVILANWTDDSTDSNGNGISWLTSKYIWDVDKCQSRNFYICERNAQETGGCNITNNCDPNANCEVIGDTYNCTCNPGFSGDGTTCTDINECSDGTNDCSEYGECTNTAGSFTCTCDWGFTGNGTSCSPQVRYGCYPDGSMYIYSLPEDSYIFVMQARTEGPDKQCTVTDVNSTAVLVTGCSKDLPMIVTYGTYSGIEQFLIQGGNFVVFVQVQCLEIGEGGNIHTISNTLTSSLVVDKEVFVSPMYQVTSSLNVTAALVGEPVSWTINYPEEYLLEVTSCTAYPGTDDSTQQPVSLISRGGCPLITDLISHFTINETGIATAVIYAFKFYQYDNVFFTCTLRVCPEGTETCKTSCSSKKRSIQGGAPRLPRSVFPATISNVLHVKDLFSSGTSLKIPVSSIIEELTLIVLFTTMAEFTGLPIN